MGNSSASENNIFHISTSDWKQINDIVLTLYGAKAEDILEDVLDALQPLVPHNHSLVYYQLSNYRPGMPVLMKSRDIPEEHIQLYIERYSKLDFINWYIDSKEGGVFRESDILSDEARAESTFMKEWLAPMDIFHGACMIVSGQSGHFGAMFIYRSKDEQDFTDRELEILKIINTHVCARFAEYPAVSNLYEWQSGEGAVMDSIMFTKREIEILVLIKSGILKGDLCDNLFITKNTLNKHLDNIYKKLDIHTYEELLQYMQQK